MADTSPATRLIRSPSRERLKKSRGSRCRWRSRSLRRSSRKRWVSQVESIRSAPPTAACTTVSPTYAAAIAGNGPKSRGISTSSTTTLKSQISRPISSGSTAARARATAIQPRRGAAYGQNARRIRRSGTAGVGTAEREPSAAAGGGPWGASACVLMPWFSRPVSVTSAGAGAGVGAGVGPRVGVGARAVAVTATVPTGVGVGAESHDGSFRPIAVGARGSPVVADARHDEG